MKRNHLNSDFYYILYRGNVYMEWSEALKLIGGARTSVMRTIEKLSLLRDEDFILYKNRKLLREEWVLNFWKNVSLASQGKELL